MPSNTIYDVLIVGGGAAGLTAALTLARQLHTVIVFDSQSYRNGPSAYMSLVLTWDHEDPAKFRAAARENILKNYETVKFQDKEILNTEKKDGSFELTDSDGAKWRGRKLVLASGVEDVFPAIDGYGACWGKRIFHCLFCKGYEERNAATSGILAVGALASEPHALHVARNALQLTPKAVTIYTNGSDTLATSLTNSLYSTPQIQVNNQIIKKFSMISPEGGIRIQFEDGTEEEEGFLGHVPPTKLKSPLASQLDLKLTPSGDILTSPPFNQSSVNGVFAAGDCSSPMKILGNAQFGGNLVGSGVAAQLQAEALGHKSLF